jgi:anthranilate/para-aminobenzoate synthase component II
MNSFFNVLMVDTFNGTTFINSMEAKNYPIYTLMFHPEFQIIDFMTEAKFPLVANEKTDEFVL